MLTFFGDYQRALTQFSDVCQAGFPALSVGRYRKVGVEIEGFFAWKNTAAPAPVSTDVRAVDPKVGTEFEKFCWEDDFGPYEYREGVFGMLHADARTIDLKVRTAATGLSENLGVLYGGTLFTADEAYFSPYSLMKGAGVPDLITLKPGEQPTRYQQLWYTCTEFAGFGPKRVIFPSGEEILTSVLWEGTLAAMQNNIEVSPEEFPLYRRARVQTNWIRLLLGSASPFVGRKTTGLHCARQVMMPATVYADHYTYEMAPGGLLQHTGTQGTIEALQAALRPERPMLCLPDQHYRDDPVKMGLYALSCAHAGYRIRTGFNGEQLTHIREEERDMCSHPPRDQVALLRSSMGVTEYIVEKYPQAMTGLTYEQCKRNDRLVNMYGRKAKILWPDARGTLTWQSALSVAMALHAEGEKWHARNGMSGSEDVEFAAPNLGKLEKHTYAELQTAWLEQGASYEDIMRVMMHWGATDNPVCDWPSNFAEAQGNVANTSC